MSQRERMRNRHSEHGLHAKSMIPRAQDLPVRLHIEQLIVEGLSHLDRERFARSVQTGLENILAERGLFSGEMRSMQAGQLMAGNVSMSARMSPEVYGQQVARAVYGGIEQFHANKATKLAGEKHR